MDTRTIPDATMTDARKSDDSHHNEATSLTLLPDDVRQVELYPRTPLRLLGLLAQTSYQYEAETAFLRLLTSAVDAEPESYKPGDETKLAAIAILKRHPELLFKTSTVIGSAAAALSAVDGQCCKNGLAIFAMPYGPDRQDGLCPHPQGIPPALAPLAGKLGSTMFVDPYDGDSCFLSSNPGDFDGYNKQGSLPSGRPSPNGAAGPVGRTRPGAAGGRGGAWDWPGGLGVVQLMKHKSRAYWELLCCNMQGSQNVVSMAMTNRADA